MPKIDRTHANERSGAGWADPLIDDACQACQKWFRKLPAFPKQVNLKTVVGFRGPTLLSEHDCVIHFARFLREAGVAWKDMHLELSLSRWMFEPRHPAAPAPGRRPWRVDLALVRRDDLRDAKLPTPDTTFQFEAFLEFAY